MTTSSSYNHCLGFFLEENQEHFFHLWDFLLMALAEWENISASAVLGK